MYRVKIIPEGQLTKVRQIVNAFVKDIDTNKLKGGAKLPSINEFARDNRVGRDTIEKAYKELKRRGYVTSFRSLGYFVRENDKSKLRVLLLFNKLSSFKKIIYYSFLDELGKEAKVDLQVHHYSPKLLKEILESSMGKYDHYVMMPHFFVGADIDECVRICKMVPSHELVLLDRNLPQLGPGYNAVYQDFKQDVYEALLSLDSLTSRYENVVLVFPEEIHHPKEIIEGIESFSKEKGMNFYLSGAVGSEDVRKQTVYIVIEEEDLAKLIKKIHGSGLVLGQDVGVISFNETTLKELLDIAVITTDFNRMGRTAAQLVLGNEPRQVKNPFEVILRGSL